MNLLSPDTFIISSGIVNSSAATPAPELVELDRLHGITESQTRKTNNDRPWTFTERKRRTLLKPLVYKTME